MTWIKNHKGLLALAAAVLVVLAVAFLAGLFIAIAIIVLMDMLNTRIRNEQEAVELLGVPVIGRFPEARGGSR